MENKIKEIFDRERPYGFELDMLSYDLSEVIKSPQDCEIVMDKLGNRLNDGVFLPSEYGNLLPLLDKITDINPKSGEKALALVDNVYNALKKHYPSSTNLDEYSDTIGGMADILPIIDMVAQKCPDLKKKALNTLKNMDALQETVKDDGLNYYNDLTDDLSIEETDEEIENRRFNKATERYQSSSLKLRTRLLKQGKEKTSKVTPTKVVSIKHGGRI